MASQNAKGLDDLLPPRRLLTGRQESFQHPNKFKIQKMRGASAELVTLLDGELDLLAKGLEELRPKLLKAISQGLSAVDEKRKPRYSINNEACNTWIKACALVLAKRKLLLDAQAVLPPPQQEPFKLEIVMGDQTRESIEAARKEVQKALHGGEIESQRFVIDVEASSSEPEPAQNADDQTGA